jgi:magnesium transporter
MSSDPATSFSVAIDRKTAQYVIKLAFRNGEGTFNADWPPSRIDEALSDQAGIVWVDIVGPEEHASPELEDWLCRHFHFHHLAVEDALSERHIAKIDDWTDYLYIVFHVAGFEAGSDTLDLHELDIFLGRNYLITYHTAPLAILEQDRASMVRDPRDRLRHGADHLLYRFLELAIDQSLAAIEHLDEQVDRIQDAVLEHASPKSLRAIFRIKRAAILLHKMLSPQREVLNRLARDPYQPVQAKHRVYFRDLYDHVVRIHDISESLRDLIGGAVETYLSVVSNRTNEIMKALTIVTVMFLPMTFLVGFFGMNFFGESLAFQQPMPRALLFWLTIAIMAVSPGFIWIYARRRNWF